MSELFVLVYSTTDIEITIVRTQNEETIYTTQVVYKLA
jgi:hypothetical protein